MPLSASGGMNVEPTGFTLKLPAKSDFLVVIPGLLGDPDIGDAGISGSCTTYFCRLLGF
jgi:hypothetical protein